MNIEVSAKERAQQDQARHRRLRFPSEAHDRADAAVSEQSMVELHPDLRQPLAPRLFQGLRLSEDDAAGGAPRRLAAGRRIAGERSRFRAPAASRFLRHQRRDHESAVADRAGRHERRAVGRDGDGRERGAARELDEARSAAEVVGGGALRGWRRVGGRGPQARRQQGLRPGVHAEPHRRGGGPQALLADLRGRGRGGAAGRHPRLRLLAAGRCRARAIRRSTSRR